MQHLHVRLIVTLAILGAQALHAVELVRDGHARATVIVAADASVTKGFPGGDRQAAEVLVDWIELITDTRLPIAAEADGSGPAVYVGLAARRAGLDMDGIQSVSHEGIRIVADETSVKLSGQNPTSTMKAVCRLLETMGCLYGFDHPLGRVYPRTTTLNVGKLDITEKPGMAMRRVWGSKWSGLNLYKVWNGCGGVPLQKGHSWGSYISASLFDEHPEWFALRGGKRYNNEWLCTSNTDMRTYFAARVIDQIEAGNVNPSISPPDGRGHCECEPCTAQDDPDSREVDGSVSKSNRYADFYDDVGRRVAATYPESILSFYAYSIYTLAPTTGKPLSDNLCAWVAAIGYCWWHGMDNPNCVSRQKVRPLYDDWARYVEKFAMRDYNYNFGDCLLPFSKVDVWRADIPTMAKIGCVGIDMETLPNWTAYSPMIYVFSRLAYNPKADVDDMLQTYFLKLYGPKAGPLVQQYYQLIDSATVALDCDPKGGGKSLEGLGKMFTPERLTDLRRLLDEAAAVTVDDQLYRERVAAVDHGLRNAEAYTRIVAALDNEQFREALALYQKMIERNEQLVADKLTNHYTVEYVNRFLGRGKELFRRAATAPPNRQLAELPDVWLHRWDKEGVGLEQGFHDIALDPEQWDSISTYREKMTNSGEYRSTSNWKYRWFRTTFQAPADRGRIGLLFVRLHKDSLVFINGKPASGPEDRPRGQWGVDFVADVEDAVQTGENILTVRRPHAWGTLTTAPVLVLDQC